jgi:1-phosphatidylinositol-3-phosphate 5-kinase
LCSNTVLTMSLSLLSFGKYIELLIYSPSLHILYPPLCEHTSISAQRSQASAISRSGLDISRHFSYGTHQVTFSLSAIDVFDVHVPRLQLSKSGNDKQTDMAAINPSPMTDQPIGDMQDPKRALRKEIIDWWQGISEHMDRLVSSECRDELLITMISAIQEEVFVRHDNLKTVLKSLPRLPSSDDAFDDCDSPDVETTPKAAISGLPFVLTLEQDNSSELALATEPPGISLPDISRHSATSSSNHKERSSDTHAPHLLSAPQSIDNLRLLSSLRHDFQREEQKLYAQLSKTSVACLNNVRRGFLTSAKGALRRLSAWETKHLPKNAFITTSFSSRDPAWWASDCHTVPDSNIIVREGDWGSIIAFTLR